MKSSYLAVIVIIIMVVAVVGYYATTLVGPSSTTSQRTATLTRETSFSTTNVIQSSQTSLQKVNFILDYLPISYEAVFYYGLVHGLFAQNGISLSIYPGSGSAISVAAVAAGKFDFGFTDAGTLAQLVESPASNVTNVRAIGLVIPYYPGIILYNKAVIKNVSDLNGKTMSSFQGSGTGLLFKVFAQRNNVNLSSIKVTYTTASQFYQLVALGKADFTPGLASNLPQAKATADATHVDLGVWPWTQFGIKLLGYPMITTSSMIAKDPALVAHFVNASMWSLYYTIKNPQEALMDMRQSNPTINITTALAALQANFQYGGVATPADLASIKNPLTMGWINPSDMQNTVNSVAQAYGIDNPKVPTSDIYTDQFVAKP